MICKRFLCFCLTLSILCTGAVSVSAASGSDTAKELTEKDYKAADALFEQIAIITDDIDVMSVGEPENAEEKTAELNNSSVQIVYEYLQTSDQVESGSVELQGEERVVWRTTDGVSCVYSPRIQSILSGAQEEDVNEPDTETIPSKKKSVHGRDVYLFQPYYQLDNSFTAQYQEEAEDIAEVTEGNYYYFRQQAATVDEIADAIETGGIVLLDSHGSTDYSGANGDYTSGATTSYLCLQTGDGLTEADYENNHAVYGGGNGSMHYYEVDGTVIANHMDRTSNNALIWNAICLGMATDGIEKPLMDKGVDVIYGYSQSVTFAGDYCFEEAFFDSLLGGATVSESVADMKQLCGEWDQSYQICNAVGWSSDYIYSTEDEARQNKAAFPIVVSDEDAYPGKGTVDGVQSVYSDWSLTDSFELTVTSDNAEAGSVSRSGMRITAEPHEGFYTSGFTVTPEGAATVKQDGDVFVVSGLRENCTVSIQFAAKTATTVHFSTPEGTVQNDMSTYLGDSVILPTLQGIPTENEQDYHFVGWTDKNVVAPVSSAAYYRPGDSYQVNDSGTVLYALYQYFATADGKTPVFSSVTENNDDWSGTYVITADGHTLLCDGSLTGAQMGNNQAVLSLQDAGMSVENGELSGAAGAYTVQLTKIPNTSYYAIRLGGSSIPLYLACRSNTNQLNTAGDFGQTYARWNVFFDNGTVKLQNVRYSARTLQFDAKNGYFRCFSAANTPLTLYRSNEECNLWYVTALGASEQSATAAPIFASNHDLMTDSDDRQAEFSFMEVPAADTVYHVYAQETGGVKLDSPEVSLTDNTLVLTFAEAPKEDTVYYISATETGKTESARTAVTVVAADWNCYDLTDDGSVDLLDLVWAVQFYGTESSDEEWSTAGLCDFDKDGTISISDFVTLRAHFTE